MKKEGFHLSASCYPAYEENMLFPGAGRQGEFSSVSAPVAEIHSDGHGLWMLLVMSSCPQATPLETPGRAPDISDGLLEGKGL